MARLIKCSDCRKKISPRADVCPNCGAPVPAATEGSRQYSLTGFLNGLLIIVCVIVGIGAYQEYLLFSIWSFLTAAIIAKPIRMAIAGRAKSPKAVGALLYIVCVGIWVFGLSVLGGTASKPTPASTVAKPQVVKEQPVPTVASEQQQRVETTSGNRKYPRDMWVASDRLARHTCPDTSCGVVGSLFFREKATVLEERNGWGRITKYYDGSCRNGESDYVDSGNRQCDSSNGFKDGKLAEWVALPELVATRPADPAAGASGAYELVAGSDDYKLYKDVFANAATSLISAGKCSAKDFRDNGGWVKSMTHKDKPVYFMYCNGYNKVYLDAGSGQVMK